MGIRINTNMDALTAQRNLSATGSMFSTAVNRLSSGLRINVAADDAAGLSISEKLRAQVGGLRQAVRNAQEGVSLIQTAEGALNEVSAILLRMRELSVQAKNGTLSNEDADAVRLEIVELEAEIDRIADTTEFNSKTLLDGSFLQSTLSADAAGNEIVANTATGSVVGNEGGVYRNISVTDPAVSGNNYSVVNPATSVVCMQAQITVAGQLVTLIQVITVVDTIATIAVGESFTFNFSTFGITFSVENVSTQTLTAANMAALVDTDTILNRVDGRCVVEHGSADRCECESGGDHFSG